MFNIKQSQDHLIFNMEIPILVKWHHYVQTPLGMIIIDPNVDTPKSKKSSLLNCTWFKYTYSKSMMNKEILYMICRWPNIVRCYDILWCSSMTKVRSHAYIDSVMSSVIFHPWYVTVAVSCECYLWPLICDHLLTVIIHPWYVNIM